MKAGPVHHICFFEEPLYHSSTFVVIGAVQQCRSTKVLKMKNCSSVPKIDDFRHC